MAKKRDTLPQAPDRVLPHNLEAERAVLGAILINNAAYASASRLLKAEHFYRDGHQRLFRALTYVIETRREVADAVTLRAALTDADDLEACGGIAYVMGLTDGIPKSTNVEYYSGLVREKWVLRELIQNSQNIVNAAYGGDDLGDLLNRADVDMVALRSASAPTVVATRDFQHTRDDGYRLEMTPPGIVLEVDRLRREDRQLHGELTLRVLDTRGFPTAAATGGVLSVGDMNFSSVGTRKQRADLFARRAGNDSIDWYGILEEFAMKIIEAERTGAPAVDLMDVPDDEDEDESKVWTLAGFPLLMEHPTIIFADGGAGKSYFAVYLAGLLAQQGVNVMYADWEFTAGEHRKRLMALFRPGVRGVHYVRCERPLKDEVERLSRIKRDKKIGFIVCDSIGFACDNRPEDAENANDYWRAMRSLKLGSLNLAHITKGAQDEKPDKPFGSAFWSFGARSIWFMQKASDDKPKVTSFGLYPKKYTLGPMPPPMARRMQFLDKSTITIENADLDQIDELSTGLPILDRIRKYLQNANGAQAPKDIAEDLGVAPGVVRATISRHAKSFIKAGKKVGVRSDRDLEF